MQPINRKRQSTSLAFREMQSKTTMKQHFTSTRIVTIKRQIITSIGMNVEKLQPSYTTSRNIKWQSLWKTACQFFSKLKIDRVCVCVYQLLSCVQLFVTPWTVADQAPLSMEFSRQEYWSRLPFPSPGDLPLEEFFSLVYTQEKQKHIHRKYCTQKFIARTSLVAQWMRLHLPVQGPRFDPWSGKQIPLAATKISCVPQLRPWAAKNINKNTYFFKKNIVKQ